jgi:hypothetical protein
MSHVGPEYKTLKGQADGWSKRQTPNRTVRSIWFLPVDNTAATVSNATGSPKNVLVTLQLQFHITRVSSDLRAVYEYFFPAPLQNVDEDSQ